VVQQGIKYFLKRSKHRSFSIIMCS